MADQRVIVIGGGLAGLAATMKIAELGTKVLLISFQPVKRSHSVCAQGGINGAVNIKGEGDSPEIHFYDTVKGGDFLANQPLCKDMCYHAPFVIYLLDRLGVPFNRTPEGNLDFRRFGGTLHHRTAFAGATTGQQLLYALDEQVRRFETQGLVEKMEWHEYLGAVLDSEGRCVGATINNLRTGEIRAERGDAVILATGGPGLVYGRSTNSMVCTGTATTSAYLQGAKYGNAEFIQIHPSAIPGRDKLRLMSESARGEGGRVWVPKNPGDERKPRDVPEDERFYFLEEKYPRFGNLVPRDVGAREIYDICINQKLGVHGEMKVYLDLTHKSREFLDDRLGGILEIYEKFTGVDPREEPMEIFPAVHYSMGGIWTDYESTDDGFINHQSPRNQMTSIPGLYAAGEADYQYHGANRLGANSLLSCIYTGLMMGPGVNNYLKNLPEAASQLPSSVFENDEKRWKERFSDISSMKGSENPYALHSELAEAMISNVLIVRENDKLQSTLDVIEDIESRWKDIECVDTQDWSNPVPSFVNQLWNMIQLSKIITMGALKRDEFRGSHYKPEFDLNQPDDFDPADYLEYEEQKANGGVHKDQFAPSHVDYMERFEKNNEDWLKSSIATYNNGKPAVDFESVDTSLIAPRPRKYD
ncbi:MAG: succinate dehydrogenase flavoprotein subunit [Deltaproteobacteria bacterium]|jgi:succinate dehydrogenase / fumarate reductase flavoprotein subunit|nr:succinate dehydrogenase flavoprotein subunit [SAR324 cluster bacterium]MEC9171847.1 succinate dehydrogenase flavoprotein subunit [SAR324 cluster bacterium]GIR32505.1 MAG: succinate dehydrogenase flavoprotein subunit [Deltaproteobacteria bacterium]|tara:strand:+ start:1941 stop:3875 length:1935 start_codon:yes stop_codon:yes gene_type:complete